MFAALGSRDSGIRTHSDKVEWVRDMEALLKFRDSGTIGEVVDWLIETQHPPIPDAVERKERELRASGHALPSKRSPRSRPYPDCARFVTARSQPLMAFSMRGLPS
jgi:hypothetical protein